MDCLQWTADYWCHVHLRRTSSFHSVEEVSVVITIVLHCAHYIQYRLLPLTLVAFGGIGAACAMGITPVYSNLLELAK